MYEFTYNDYQTNMSITLDGYEAHNYQAIKDAFKRLLIASGFGNHIEKILAPDNKKSKKEK